MTGDWSRPPRDWSDPSDAPWTRRQIAVVYLLLFLLGIAIGAAAF